ncbi:MAG TPA: asparagine synthase (glutamine-hydrolyzing) [Nitrospiraceae bacterium]|nr:asparagine synthase (glutamine-hydrolyzing) [Nitrospiraceae bacterium]
MCGLCGFLDLRTEESPRVLLETMTRSLQHRGPDGLGMWMESDQTVGLGHTRLAVIDVEHGRQPMHSADGRYVIVLNGEVYNFRELRLELESNGHRFMTDSDTEVLLESFARWRENCLERLRGMFAFAVFDRTDRSLFLARDRTGIKPLYYHAGARGFVFGSELKAVLAANEMPRRLHYPALAEFLSLSYTIPPKTFFEDIHELVPGTWLSIGQGGLSRARYWTWTRRPADWSETLALDLSEQALVDSLAEHLVSDVPVGAFLSGGIDSSVLVALLVKVLGKRLPTFTVAFDAAGYDESPYARVVAQELGTEHHEIVLKSGEGDLSLVDAVLNRFDQPFGDSSAIPTFLICHEVRKSVKVVIGGDGADEMFGGYRRFWHADLARTVGRFPDWGIRAFKTAMHVVGGATPVLSRQSRRFLHAAGCRDGRRLLALSCYTFPEDLSQILTHPASEQAGAWPESTWRQSGESGGPGGPEFVDATVERALPGDYLRKVDMMSSAHGLEVRLPFLGEKVLECAAKLAMHFRYTVGSNKILLRKLAAKYLPPAISAKAKGGFGIPLDTWLGEGGRKDIQASLLSPSARIGDLIRPDYVQQLLSDFVQGGWDHSKMSRANLYQQVYFLWALERWLDRWKPVL